MGKSCQLVMGPAGTGKVGAFTPFGALFPLLNCLRYTIQSTYCQTMMSHFEAIGRPAHLFNLDPAAEEFEYQPTIGEPVVWLLGLLLVILTYATNE